MSYATKRNIADAIRRWIAPTIAMCLDRGWIVEWPFELTRAGRRVLRER